MKTLVRIHNVEQGTPEWEALRHGLYTGTSADRLLRFGAIEYSKTESGNFGGNFYTRRGHELEHEALGLYTAITGLQVATPGFITNNRYPICGYSPDGIAGMEVIELEPGIELLQGGILLEVKAFTEVKHEAIRKGDIPFKVLAQIHFGLFVSGLREARLIAYNPDVKNKAGEFDPTRALVIITVKVNRNITNNFKSKLIGKEAPHALYTNQANA